MEKEITKLISKEDKSANFVLSNGQEARYVRRTDDYFIVYLSSHNGCNQACRFCHLTQSRQLEMQEATVADMHRQAMLVINHHIDMVTSDKELPAKCVHFNWMARGDAMHSEIIRKNWHQLSTGLYEMCEQLGITSVKFNISSIFPENVGLDNEDKWIEQLNTTYKPTFFYSLYSMDKEFRKRWMPKAMPPFIVLEKLKKWQDKTDMEVVLHWAFIEGQNDSEKQMTDVLLAVEYHRLKTRFNLVRYNPFTSLQGQESSEEVIEARFEDISRIMKLPGSRIVPRVGFDVSASCGMFIKQY